jgi:hypothetical protein
MTTSTDQPALPLRFSNEALWDLLHQCMRDLADTKIRLKALAERIRVLEDDDDYDAAGHAVVDFRDSLPYVNHSQLWMLVRMGTETSYPRQENLMYKMFGSVGQGRGTNNVVLECPLVTVAANDSVVVMTVAEERVPLVVASARYLAKMLTLAADYSEQARRRDKIVQ